MMSSFISQDSELGTQHVAGSDSSVSTTSGTFRPFSPARRLFCLLTAFDFLAALFIWILHAHAFTDDDEKFEDSLREEVKDYKFKKSLFDIMLLAVWRMTLLLLAYALFVSRKVHCVAVTTAITTAFLLVKVILTSFKSPKGNATLYYVLVLSSLVMSWVEAWVLDVKVIPSEVKAEQRSQRDERRPLLHDRLRGQYTPFSEHSFYTPEASDSENESDRDDHDRLAAAGISLQDQQFIQKGKETIEETWQLMEINEGWKSEKVKDGIIVESRVKLSGKKIYRLKSSLDAKAEDVFNLIICRPEDAPKWGGNVTSSFVLRQIDEHTDIVYNTTGVAGGGMVSSRDFVNLRRWEQRGDVFVSSNVAVQIDEMPPKPEHVRGENGPGGWAFREAKDNPNRTEYVWLFDVDLKGWLPQSVIDTALSFMLYSTGQGVRNYVQENLG